MKHKAKLFAQDAEIQGLLKELQASFGPAPVNTSKFSSETAKQLQQTSFDINAIASKGLKYEQLDQLVIDLLLGVRG